MGKRKISLRHKLRNFFEMIADRSKFALVGTGQLLKRPKYLISFIVSLIIFLYILSFFRDGSGNWQLLTSGLELGRKFEVLGRVFIGVFENFTSLGGIILVFLAILQALIIPLLIHSWKNREKDQVIDGASTGSIGAIFGFLALGCPTCGVGLLTPILSAIAGASALALTETVGNILTALAFLLLLYTVIKLGYVAFINISNEKIKKEKHAKSN